MEETFVSNPATWIGLFTLIVMNIIIILREVVPKLVSGFIDYQHKRAARMASSNKAENDQKLELTRQIYEEQKAKDDRMYALMDKFSDRLVIFSEELTKFSVTMQMIMVRLESIESIQHKILSNQEEIDNVVSIIENTIIQHKPIPNRRRRKISNTPLIKEPDNTTIT